MQYRIWLRQLWGIPAQEEIFGWLSQDGELREQISKAQTFTFQEALAAVALCDYEGCQLLECRIEEVKVELMDPNKNLERQLFLVEHILHAKWDGAQTSYAECGIELAELVEALHNWLVNSGALPDQWKHSK